MTNEKIKLGPILHARQSTEDSWRFSVSIFVEEEKKTKYQDKWQICFSSETVCKPKPKIRLSEKSPYYIFQWEVQAPRKEGEYALFYEVGAVDVSNEEATKYKVVIPAKNQLPRMAFFSCNGVDDPKIFKKIDRKSILWEQLCSRHEKYLKNKDVSEEQRSIHLLIGGGDQIYADQIWNIEELRQLSSWEDKKKMKVNSTLRRRLQEAYFEIYMEQWAPSLPCAKMFAQVPMLLTWDDHEIFDGWGSYNNDLQDSPLFQALYNAAKNAFVVFQLGTPSLLHKKPTTTDSCSLIGSHAGTHHFLQALQFGKELAIISLDLRSNRTSTQIMGKEQWDDLINYMSNELVNIQNSHILVVSSVPTTYLNFNFVENLLGWLPGRQEYEDDLRDQWESSAHQGERIRLLMNFFDFSRGNKITILSGDVHVGSYSTFKSKHPEHLVESEQSTVIYQIVSSAIVYPPPEGLSLIGMRLISGKTPVLLKEDLTVMLQRFANGDYILPKRNWLSIEPDENIQSKGRLWIRWVTEEGNLEPPIVIEPRIRKQGTVNQK